MRPLTEPEAGRVTAIRHGGISAPLDPARGTVEVAIEDLGKFEEQQHQARAQAVAFALSHSGEEWTVEAGDVRWYLYDLATEKIIEDPYEIVQHIRSTPETPRICRMEQKALVDLRASVDKHIKNTYLKQVQAPIGVKLVLKAWMELSKGS